MSTTQRRIVIALLALALLAGAFAAGRYSVPPQEARIEYRSLEVEDITRGFKWVQDTRRTTKKNVTTSITDAGTTIVDLSTETLETMTARAAAEVVNRSAAVESIQQVKQTNRPNWRVGALIGASYVPPALPIAGPLVVGPHVEHRLAGPFWLGVWGLTLPAGGVSVTGEF